MWVLLLSGLLITGCKQTADPFELALLLFDLL